MEPGTQRLKAIGPPKLFKPKDHLDNFLGNVVRLRVRRQAQEL